LRTAFAGADYSLHRITTPRGTCQAIVISDFEASDIAVICVPAIAMPIKRADRWLQGPEVRKVAKGAVSAISATDEDDYMLNVEEA
jgi:hypothetical protein